jgi:patatin-like phospholipase/uncharacterized protein DUF3376
MPDGTLEEGNCMAVDSTPTAPRRAAATQATGDPAAVRSEIRIGLAMSGAIALVLYESGVAHEIYRFIKAWDTLGASSGEGGYAAAFRAIPIRPVLDILTGASAGGINSILLGSSVATGQDFAQFHDLWVDLAGIDRLRYPWGAQPRSLLNTDPLVARMEEVLRLNVGATGGQPDPSAPDLVVRLCRTHQRGHCLIARDAIGHKMEIDSKADVVGFGTEHFVRWNKDQPDENQIAKLIRAALATSAFPGAFAPVQDEGRWYIDGGLWNNQPIDLAVEAVRDKPAFLKTYRCILFIEPDPSKIPAEEALAPPVDEPEPSVAQVLSSLPFMGLKGDIWASVQDILDYNRRRTLYDRLEDDPTAGQFACSYGCQQWKVSRSQLRKARLLFGADAVTQRRLEKLAAQVALSRSLELPAARELLRESIRARMESVPALFNQVRIDEILFDRDLALIQRWNALREGLSRLPTSVTGARPAGFADEAALAALDAMGGADLLRLVARHELAKINNALSGNAGRGQTAPEETHSSGASESARPLHQIAAEKAVLYTRLEQLNHYLNADNTRPTPDSRKRYLERQLAFLDRRRDVDPQETTAIDAQRERLKAGLADIERWERREQRRADEEVADQDAALYRLGQLRESSRFREATAAMLLEAESALGEQPDLIGYEAALTVLNTWVQQIREVWLQQIRPQAGPAKPPWLLPLSERDLGEESPYHAIRLYHRQARNEQREVEITRRTRIFVDPSLLVRAAQSVPKIGPPTAVDVALYILRAISDLPGRRRIDLIRISPNDTNNLHLTLNRGKPDATAAVRKLAGEGLGHFTGFFETRWRRNDYIWGRLDACEILLRTLRSYAERDPEFQGAPVSESDYRSWLEAGQTQILKEEAASYKEWLRKNEPDPGRQRSESEAVDGCKSIPFDPNGRYGTHQATQKANARLIGFGQEGFPDADEPGFSGNLDYLLQTTIRLARGHREQPPAALDRLSRVLRIASYPLRLLAATVPVQKPSVRSIWQGIGVILLLLALVALLAWGAGTGHLAAALTTIGYGAAVGLLLIAYGCNLGYRLAFVVPLVLAIGLLIGALHPQTGLALAAVSAVGMAVDPLIGWVRSWLASRRASTPARAASPVGPSRRAHPPLATTAKEVRPLRRRGS